MTPREETIHRLAEKIAQTIANQGYLTLGWTSVLSHNIESLLAEAIAHERSESFEEAAKIAEKFVGPKSKEGSTWDEGSNMAMAIADRIRQKSK